MHRRLATLEEGLVIVLMAAMTIVTFLQVVARYVLNTTALSGRSNSPA